MVPAHGDIRPASDAIAPASPKNARQTTRYEEPQEEAALADVFAAEAGVYSWGNRRIPPSPDRELGNQIEQTRRSMSRMIASPLVISATPPEYAMAAVSRAFMNAMPLRSNCTEAHDFLLVLKSDEI